jgi:hypothetical protein
MTADEVLEALKGRITDFWYDILKEWLSIQPMHGLFRAKYKITPQITSYGYNVIDLYTHKGIAVHTEADDL